MALLRLPQIYNRADNKVVHPSTRAERFGMESQPRVPGDHKRSPTKMKSHFTFDRHISL